MSASTRFYGWKVENGQRLARLAVRHGSETERLLTGAGWLRVRWTNIDYSLWLPPADVVPKPRKTPAGPVIDISEALP